MSNLYYTSYDRCQQKKFKTSTAVRKHWLSSHKKPCEQTEFAFRSRVNVKEWTGVLTLQLLKPTSRSFYLQWLTALTERINGSFTPLLQG